MAGERQRDRFTFHLLFHSPECSLLKLGSPSASEPSTEPSLALSQVTLLRKLACRQNRDLKSDTPGRDTGVPSK